MMVARCQGDTWRKKQFCHVGRKEWVLKNLGQIVNEVSAGFASNTREFVFLGQLEKNIRLAEGQALRIEKTLLLQPKACGCMKIMARTEKRVARLVTDDENTVTRRLE